MKTVLVIGIVFIAFVTPGAFDNWANGYPGLPSYIEMNIAEDDVDLPLKSIYDPDYRATFTDNGTERTTSNYTEYQIDEGFILTREQIGRTAINATALFFDVSGTNYNIENVTLELPGRWIVPLQEINGVQYSLGMIPPGVYLVNVLVRDSYDNLAGFQGIISYGVRLTDEVRETTDQLIVQANDPRAPSGLFTLPKGAGA